MSVTAEVGNYENGYQLTVAPSSFYKINGKPMKPSCILCNEELEFLDRFDDLQNGVRTNFYFTGLLKMCPSCGHAHYIVDKTDTITGPVTVQWKN